MVGGYPKLRMIYKMQEEVMKRRMVIFNSSLIVPKQRKRKLRFV
jgi:hypothetical protein